MKHIFLKITSLETQCLVVLYNSHHVGAMKISVAKYLPLAGWFRRARDSIKFCRGAWNIVGQPAAPSG